jgi:hypothetical protein
MARINGSVLGNLSGKLGNLSARTRNGVTILGARPSSFNASQTPAVLAIRKKFSVSAQVAKVVGSIDDLNKIWDKVRLAGTSVFNTVIQKNFQYSDEQRPTAQNIITPGGFNLVVTSAVVAADNITISLPALNGQANFSADEKDLSMSILLVGFDPVNAGDNYYKIMSFNHTEADYDPAAVLEAVVNLDQYQQNELARYNQKVLLIGAATKDANAKIVQYSATYGNES